MAKQSYDLVFEMHIDAQKEAVMVSYEAADDTAVKIVSTGKPRELSPSSLEPQRRRSLCRPCCTIICRKTRS
jgi:hypothetical protein